MASKPITSIRITSLADRLIQSLSNPKSSQRNRPCVFNVGLDFGTAYTKCIIRDVNNDAAYPLLVRIRNREVFLIPSEVRIRNGRLTVPFDADFDGDPVNYLKMALAAVADSREREAWLKNIEQSVPSEWRDALPQNILAVTAFYLARILIQAREFIRRKQPDFGRHPEDRLFVNMAVPVGHAQMKHIEKIFLEVLCHAYYMMDLPRLTNLSVQEVANVISNQNKEAGLNPNCYLYPEVSANVQSYIRSPAARGDLHVFVDVGAGTVDLSAFIYFPQSSVGKTLNYLAADVVSLGSSQIELKAARYCNAPLREIREFKETGNADSAQYHKISKAVRSAKRDVEMELRPKTEKLLEVVRDLIPTARDKRRRDTQFYRAQLLLGGGGMCDDPYKTAVKNAMAAFDIENPPILPLPVPIDLVWPDAIGFQKNEAYKRLSVAYGLSFLKATLDEHRFPFEIKRIPVSRPTSNYVPRQAPTKDEM